MAARAGAYAFPTRRSSDLGGAALEPGDRSAGALAPVAVARGGVVGPVRRGVGVAGADPHQRRGERGDRKSTRLNSSHTVISYAVFCLKKKNRKNSESDTL